MKQSSGKKLKNYYAVKLKSYFVNHVEYLQKIIYFLCFVALVLSMTVAVIKGIQNLSFEFFQLIIFAVDCLIVILHKIYTYVTELNILGLPVNKRLRENSFIVHDRYFAPISDEINLFCRIIFVLLTAALICYGFVCGNLSLLLALDVLFILVILKLKAFMYFMVSGKIFDRIPPKRQYKVFRGYAKLFLQEYRLTSFKRKDPFYEKKQYYEYSVHNERQDVSVKSQLFFEVKFQLLREKHKLIAITVFLIMVFMLLFYIPANEYLDKMLHYCNLGVLSSYPVKEIVVFVLNVFLCLVSATTLLHYKYSCSYVNRIIDCLNGESSEDRIKQYEKIDKKKTDFRRIRTFGLMTVCADRGYAGLPNDMKELLNRPLFIHQLYTPFKDYLLFTGALIISIILILSSFVDFITLIVIIGAVLFLSLILHFLVIPCGKKLIVKHWCKKINKTNEGRYE